MNKKITTAGILCMMTCAATAYCWETNEKKCRGDFCLNVSVYTTNSNAS